MKPDNLESAITTLEATVKQLEAKIQLTEDIEAIKKLQRPTAITWNTGRKKS